MIPAAQESAASERHARERARRRRDIALWVAAGLTAVLLAIGGWNLHWWLKERAVNNNYRVNVNSQQYQAGIVDHLRDIAAEYATAADGQREQLKVTFCAQFENLNPAPADLQHAHDVVFACQ